MKRTILGILTILVAQGQVVSSNNDLVPSRENQTNFDKPPISNFLDVNSPEGAGIVAGTTVGGAAVGGIAVTTTVLAVLIPSLVLTLILLFIFLTVTICCCCHCPNKKTKILNDNIVDP